MKNIIKIKDMEKNKNKIQDIIIISLLGVLLILGVFTFIKSDNPQIQQAQEIIKEIAMGSASDSVGDYKVVTTTGGNWNAVSTGPAILHKIIVGNANDEIRIANDTVSPSTTGLFYMKPTVPATFDMEIIFSQGIIAYVTSTNGIIFVTSPY